MFVTVTEELLINMPRFVVSTLPKFPSRTAKLGVAPDLTVTRFAAFCPTITSEDLDENDVTSCPVMS